ncbi:MAG: NAD(P)/FAD-dependent oxidoreductase, partial [Clostridia bacterium]|nr:NAD(P)/FAD-dependent oxidoreductase [Clostridia bacterium]
SITIDILGQVSEIEVSGVFIAVGSKPESPLLSLVNLDNNGYMLTDKNMMTSLPGVYAAGDIVSKPVRQIITACADGATAAESIVKSLNAKK